MTADARFVVVGGGVVAAAAAYQLARRGAAVIIVEGDQPGIATNAGAGRRTRLNSNALKLIQYGHVSNFSHVSALC